MRRHVTILLASMAMLAMTLPVNAKGHVFPNVIPLPDGIQPEGIATGSGPEFFAGSIATGSIYKGDLRTGEVALLSQQDDRSALGMKHDARSDTLWVAGGPTGQGFLYDADTGATIASLTLTDPGTFVNDVVVTRTAAFFTDSFRPVIYEVPLDQRGLPAGSTETIDLTGDFVFVPGDFNANGIDATPDGKTLVLVNSALGQLYTVDPDTGEATSIDLGGAAVPSGDGILLDGKTIYVVQNFLNQISVVELSPQLTSGEVADTITSDDFRIPTTAGEFGSALYVVNARFDVPPTPITDYEVVRISKP